MGLTLAVVDPALARDHPRRAGSDLYLSSSRDGTGSSPDYFTEVDGLRLSRFVFPRMPAVGRDRETQRMGTRFALAGMGVMRYLHLAFDVRGRALYAWPGAGYATLGRAGLELDDHDGTGARVFRVVRDGAAEAADVREGDVVTAVNGEVVTDAPAARAAIARSAGARSLLRVARNGNTRDLAVELSEATVLTGRRP